RTGKVEVVDADITGFFDNIDHERLLDEVNRRIADGRVLKLIRAFLEAGVMEEMEVRFTATGTPHRRCWPTFFFMRSMSGWKPKASRGYGMLTIVRHEGGERRP